MAYLLPPVFLIISNAFIYVDPRYAIVSRVMGDGFLRRFWTSALRPVAGACVSAFMLGFFLAFTDFGIPISIAGQYDVVATELYSTMMGAVPDFGRGAVVAISMMVPAVGAVALLRWSEKLNFRSTDIVEIKKTLEFFGLDPEDEGNQKRLRNLENGQCLMQDLYGHVGVVQFHPVFADFLHGFDTKPPMKAGVAV